MGSSHRFRAASIVTVDGLAAAVSFPIALALRVGADAEAWGWDFMLYNGMLFAAVWVIVAGLSGLHRASWRFTSILDLGALGRAVLLTELAYVPLAFLVSRLDAMPRSLFVLQSVTLFALLVIPRLMWRLLRDGSVGWDDAPREPVLVIGTGSLAALFLRAARESGSPWGVVGLIDEHRGAVGTRIYGVDVLGTLEDDLPALIESVHPTPRQVLIASESLGGPRLRAVFDQVSALGLTLGRVPRLTQTTDPTKIEVRPVSLDDLLNRPARSLDAGPVEKLVGGRRVLVTGAGGSIGSELVRQIAAHQPTHIALVENSEYALYAIDRYLRDNTDCQVSAWICDVRDRGRLDQVFESVRPEVVCHAAALKHVPLVEHNPREGVLTNVMGTCNVVDAARAVGTEVVVMISTDKAVNPTSVMGATKRVAETYCQAIDVDGGPRIATVRFGNVLGSSGSVVPLFQRQIAEGGPLTVTHPDVERYFMTIPEAVLLVLNAAALADRRHTPGGVYVLDMGDPIRIVDLARQMAQLAGRADCPVVFTGLRPGEKLTEEPLHLLETLGPTEVSGIMLGQPRQHSLLVLRSSIARLIDAAQDGSASTVMSRLSALVPEYQPRRPTSEEVPCRLP